jgi:hypothetical protein
MYCRIKKNNFTPLVLFAYLFILKYIKLFASFACKLSKIKNRHGCYNLLQVINFCFKHVFYKSRMPSMQEKSATNCFLDKFFSHFVS